MPDKARLTLEEGLALKIRAEQLEYVVRETLWMARRYAHKRSTFAPSTLNECVDLALKLGVSLDPDGVTGGLYADDGMLGAWNPETQRFEKE